jgi:curved DNA-binding protein CbpA
VKDAYFRLAKRFHPDVHHGASLGDLRDKLEAVFIKLGEAYDTLRDKGRRGDYEARLGRARPQAAGATASSPEAPGGRPPSGAYEPLPRDPEEEARVTEETLRKAARLLEQAKALEQEKPGDNQHQRLIFDAIQLLEPLLPGLQGKTRLRAQLHLARAYMKNPKWLKRAEEMLIEASRDNPQSAEAYSALGSIYHVRGMRSRALSMYKKVLELKPDHEEAFKFVAENTTGDDLPQEPEGGGGGLLGRLFRKG